MTFSMKLLGIIGCSHHELWLQEQPLTLLSCWRRNVLIFPTKLQMVSVTLLFFTVSFMKQKMMKMKLKLLSRRTSAPHKMNLTRKQRHKTNNHADAPKGNEGDQKPTSFLTGVPRKNPHTDKWNKIISNSLLSVCSLSVHIAFHPTFTLFMWDMHHDSASEEDRW